MAQPTNLIVCPTSHMDWDWNSSFEEYFKQTTGGAGTGPVFKATHNFLMPAAPGSGATFALAAIYHDGMPAWACSDGQILGSLFRNTDGTQRGASGTDTDTHTQRYALRISTTPLDPRTGQPLTEALEFAQPLMTAVASPSNQPESPVTLQGSASLASAPAPALVRVVRPMGVETSAVGTAPGAFIALPALLLPLWVEEQTGAASYGLTTACP
jgi:hypothetical protein